MEWINNLLELDLPLDISEPYLCEIFLDGTVLRGILKKLHIDVTEEVNFFFTNIAIVSSL